MNFLILDVKSAQDAASGGFLRHRSVVEAKIIDHIKICDE